MFGLFKRRQAVPDFHRSQLVPRIKNTQFRQSLVQMGLPEEQLPIVEPLVADLVVTYAFDLPATFVMATPVHLIDAQVDVDRLQEIAIENLSRQIASVEIRQHGDFFQVAIGDNLDACALLVRTLWDQCAADMQGPLVAVVPNRDLVLFCDSTNRAAVEQIRAISQEAHDDSGTHGLTRALLAWTASGWTAR